MKEACFFVQQAASLLPRSFIQGPMEEAPAKAAGWQPQHKENVDQ